MVVSIILMRTSFILKFHSYSQIWSQLDLHKNEELIHVQVYLREKKSSREVILT